MIFLTQNNIAHKNICVIFDKDCCVIRILTPLCTKQAVNSKKELLTTNVCKNKYFNLDDNKYYYCSHEIFLNKTTNLFKGGNHVVVFTNTDLYANNQIGICIKDDLPKFENIKILCEFLCSNDKEDFDKIDCLIYTNINGLIITNKNNELNKLNENFNFKINIKKPNFVKTNQNFIIEIYKNTLSNKKVNSIEIIDCISGYIPNRLIIFNEGIAIIKCNALLLEKDMMIKYHNIFFTVQVKND